MQQQQQQPPQQRGGIGRGRGGGVRGRGRRGSGRHASASGRGQKRKGNQPQQQQQPNPFSPFSGSEMIDVPTSSVFGGRQQQQHSQPQQQQQQGDGSVFGLPQSGVQMPFGGANSTPILSGVGFNNGNVEGEVVMASQSNVFQPQEQKKGFRALNAHAAG